MLFSRQEYWNGVPFPTPGVLSNPEIEPTSLVSPELAGRFFITSATWEAHMKITEMNLWDEAKAVFKRKFLDFSGSPVVKNPPANVENMGSIPDLGRFHKSQGN